MSFRTVLSRLISNPWILLLTIGIVLIYEMFYKTFLKRKKILPPGPRGLPFVGYLPFLGSEPHKKFSQLSKSYGNVFSLRLGTKDVVILNDWLSIKEAFSKDIFLGRPENSMFDKFGISNFINLNGHEWREQRRFALKNLRNLGFGKNKMETHVKAEISYLLEQINKSQGQPVGVRKYLSPSTFNVIAALVTGHRYDFEHPTRLSLDKAFDHEYGVSMTGVWSLFPDLAFFLARLGVPAFKRIQEKVDILRKYIDSEVDQHLESYDKNNIRDFIDGYIQEMDEKRDERCTTFNRKNMVSVSLAFYGAGSDTTRTALEWFLLLVTVHPQVQRRIHQEMDTVTGGKRAPSYSDRENMPYTEATLCEVVRLQSIVPINAPRMTYADTAIQGRFIPKGIQVLANFWAVNRDPKLWPEPEQFKPTRFLSEDRKRVVKPEHFIPFSYGKRSCLGESLGSLELFLYSTHILHKYILKEPENNKISLEDKFGLVSIPKHAPSLCFVPRIADVSS